MSKYKTNYLLLKQGGGYPFGVAAEHAAGGYTELHGPFENYTVAQNYARHLRAEYSDYGNITVVKIEIPYASKS